MDKILLKIKKIIINKFEIEDSVINYNSDIIKDLGLDSLDFIEFIMELEKEFNIEISNKESEKINNIKKCVCFIKKKTDGNDFNK